MLPKLFNQSQNQKGFSCQIAQNFTCKALKQINSAIRVILAFYVILIFHNCASSPELQVSNSKDKQSSSAEETEKLSRAKKILSKANSLFQSMEYDEALKKGKESIEVYPTWEGYYLTGSCFFKKGKYPDAKTDFLKGIDLSGSEEQLLITYAYLLTTMGETDEAIKVYSKLEKEFPNESLYTFKKGVLLKTSGNYQESYSTLSKISPEKFSRPEELYMHLGDVCFQLKKYKESEDYFKKAGTTGKDARAGKLAFQAKVSEHLDRGNSYLRMKDYSNASSSFKEAAQIDPKNSMANFLYGYSLLLLKKQEASIPPFEKALLHNPEYREAYVELASAYSDLKKYNKADSVISEGIKHFPQDWEMHYKKGIIYKNSGQSQKALVSLFKARNLAMDKAEPYIGIGQIFLEDSKYSDALREFEKAFPLKNGDLAKPFAELARIHILIEKGDSYFHKNKKDLALKEYEKAYSIKKDEPVVLNSFGKLYFSLLKYKDSEKYYLNSLEIEKDNIPALIGLSRLYSVTGKSAQAAELLSRLKKRSSEDPFYSIAIAKIYEDKKEYKEAEKVYLDSMSRYKDNETFPIRLGLLYYKIAIDENSKEEFASAITSIEKAKVYYPELPNFKETYEILKYNSKIGEILPLIRQANKYFDSRDFESALKEYKAAYNKIPRPLLLVKISECYTNMGKKEEALQVLRNEINSSKEPALEIQEALGAYYIKINDNEKAEETFNSILKEHPQSYYSYYQLGILKLDDDPKASLDRFNKSIFWNPEFVPAKIARGISYYKSGDKDSARDEFLAIDSKHIGVEIARYNLGIMLMDEKLMKDSEKLFQELIISNPDFSDPFFELAYINYKNGNYRSAKSFIKKAIQLESKPLYLYTYIRILESENISSNSKDIASLKKELIEKFPSSIYSKNLTSEYIQSSNEAVIQPYPLNTEPVSEPILINGKLYVNYGSAISAIDKNMQTIWRIENSYPSKLIAANTRLFALSKKYLKQINLDTGKELWSVSLQLKSVKKIMTSENIYFSGVEQNGSYMIYSYDILGNNLGKLKIQKDTLWTVAENDMIFTYLNSDIGFTYCIYNFRFEKNIEPKDIQAPGAENLFILRTGKNFSSIIRGKDIYKLESSSGMKKTASMDDTIIGFYKDDKDVILKTSSGFLKLNDDDVPTEFYSKTDIRKVYKISDNSFLAFKEDEWIITDSNGEELEIKKFDSENNSKKYIYSLYFNSQKSKSKKTNTQN